MNPHYLTPSIIFDASTLLFQLQLPFLCALATDPCAVLPAKPKLFMDWRRAVKFIAFINIPARRWLFGSSKQNSICELNA